MKAIKCNIECDSSKYLHLDRPIMFYFTASKNRSHTMAVPQYLLNLYLSTTDPICTPLKPNDLQMLRQTIACSILFLLLQSCGLNGIYGTWKNERIDPEKR